MKKLNVLAIVAIFVMGFASVSCDSRKSVSLKSGVDSVSFLIGASYGGGLKENIKTFPGGEAGNVNALIDGFVKAAQGDTLLLGLSQEEAQAYVNNYFQQAQVRAADVTLKEGENFLAQNKGKDGVFTTESGLQYKVLTEGTGIKPTLEDTVLVHYTGKMLDGTEWTVFESSVERGEPVKFGVGQVIPGWKEGVLLMPKGSKYTLWIPAELGYGAPGQGPIKPNSALEFEVELLDVFKAK
jgi:FKBP-type peptidyl-prolyl cis-trans isomerase